MQNLEDSSDQHKKLTEDAIVLSQLQELRLLNPQLVEFAQRLHLKVKKIDAVLDFSEVHEEKYARLFKPLPNYQGSPSAESNLDYDAQT
jgi:hypothetical protein